MAAATQALEVCRTQDGVMPTFGALPAQRPASHGSKESTIVLGFSSLIPRWDIVTQRNPKIHYYFQKESFPSEDDHYQVTVSAFQEAVKEWNNVRLGLTFHFTNDPIKANFHIVYQVSHPDDRPDDPSKTNAKAFFPINPQDIIVYEPFFHQADRTKFKNTFIHELGHVLGLRHEFAEDNKGVQFMQANDKSIMTYDLDNRSFQQSDKEGTKAFYQLKNGCEIDGVAIKDYPVELRKITPTAAA